jgi:hypothetical protein
MSDLSGDQIVFLRPLFCGGIIRERLAVSKRTTHRVHMERFNLKKLNEVEGKEQCHV